MDGIKMQKIAFFWKNHPTLVRNVIVCFCEQQNNKKKKNRQTKQNIKQQMQTNEGLHVGISMC